ncbi:MAG: ABC transporter permease [Alphaproteobacteria bacterium]
MAGELPSGSPFQMRFAAIWLALAVLIALSAVFVPRSLQPSSLLAVIPLAAFLAIAAMGQAMVLMARGIDLSVPAIVTLSSTILLGASGGSDAGIAGAVALALALAAAVGLVNGVLVGVLQLNALIVTLAVGAIVAGLTLWYREGLPPESGVPPLLAALGGLRILGLNFSVWVTLLLVIVLSVVLRKTVAGRRFAAVGANPRAAHIAGIGVARYQIAAFLLAALLYCVAGILLSAFIRNPTLEVGTPYLLAPIAAAVLGGTALGGGIGRMTSVAGAALFLIHLGQMLQIMGISTAWQMIAEGVAIALGMGLSQLRLPRLRKPIRSASPAPPGPEPAAIRPRPEPEGRR